MKACKYCGAENDNKVTVCCSCGANEFDNRCENCGNVYDKGNFCPRCGVKAGAKAKICPNCGTEYFSNACSNCGYTAMKNHANNTTDINNAGTASLPVKSRKTWLWVLGWIFIFPVPLTILILKNKKLDMWLRVTIIVSAWLVYLLIGIVGNNTP